MRHDCCQKRPLPRKAGSNFVVESLSREIAFGTAAIFDELPMENPRQPGGGERRHNYVRVTVGTAEQRAGFTGSANDAQHGRQHEFYAGELEIFAANMFHTAPPHDLPADFRRRSAAGTSRERALATALGCRILTAPVSSA